jgi:signal transduction histidine kinase
MRFDPLRLLRARYGFWLLVAVTLLIYALEFVQPPHPPSDYSGYYWLPLLLVPALNRPLYLLGLGVLDLGLTLWLVLTGSDGFLQTMLQELPIRAAVFLLILWLDQLRFSHDYSRQLLEAIQVSSPMGMALVERRSGRLLRVNPAMASLLGSSPERLEGRCWLDFGSSLPEVSPAHRQQLFRCDGNPRWVQLGVHPLNLIGLTRQLLVVQALDCQASVEAEAILAAQAEELRRQLAVSLEACSLSHEIRQPLSLLQLQCRLLLQRLESASEDAAAGQEPPRSDLTADLEALAALAEQIDSTITAMVSLLRSGSSPQERADLAAILRICLRSLQPRFAAAGVQLSSQGLEAPLPLLANQVQLRIACGNLLLNSLEAVRDQLPSQRRIHVQLVRTAAQVELRVADSGPGLRGRSLQDLTLASSRSDGMGLGLFTTALIANHHNGQLRAGTSAELGGAELRLLLSSG